MAGRQQRSLLWKLTSRRLAQVIGGILLVSALVLFAKPLYAWVLAQLGEDWVFSNGTAILFWTVFGVTILAPLVAVWRNIGVLALIVAEWVTKGSRSVALQPLLERALQGVALLLLLIWLLAMMPFGWSVLWAFLVVIGVMALLAMVLWRRLVIGRAGRDRVAGPAAKRPRNRGGSRSQAIAQDKATPGTCKLEEYVLPEFSASAGKTIGELALRKRFGCSIASIDRHGISTLNPSASVPVYPQDKLLLLGSAAQVDNAMVELETAKTHAVPEDIEEFSLETIQVPDQSPAIGKTLAQLDPFRRAGVQVAESKGAQRILTPSGNDYISRGDELLVLGTGQILQFEQWLQGVAPELPPAQSSPAVV